MGIYIFIHVRKNVCFILNFYSYSGSFMRLYCKAHVFIHCRDCYSELGMKTFFFYDLETSGLNARSSRIMQFAGIRTDMDLKPIGEPINVLIRLSDDILPDPGAVLVTGITPQSTLADGLAEPEFCRLLMEEVFTPDTITVGFNSVR